MWHSRMFSSNKFLTSFKNLSAEKTYQFDVVDLELRHWREVPSFEQLKSRCDQLSGVELVPQQLIMEMEQEVLTGQQGNIEVVDISDKQLKLQVNKLKRLKAEYVLFLDRVDEDFDKLDRKWAVDTFMPILALHAHKDDIISEVLPSGVKTFEIFDDEVTRKDYLKFKKLLQGKSNYCVAETLPLDVSPAAPTHSTPPEVNKTTKKQTRADTREEEKQRREELAKKRTVMPETGKKKRKLF